MGILAIVIQGYMIVCVVRIIFSWLPDMAEGSPLLSAVSDLSYMLTEPLFGTVRRAMPRIGDLPIDFSPIVVFFGLGLLLTIVNSLPG